MNSFAYFTLIIAAVSLATASPASSSSASGSAVNSAAAGINANQEADAQDVQSPAAAVASIDLTRLRKSAGGYGGGASGGYGGGASIPAPPCPKNYLFSCQPNLAPIPCSAPAPSYGSAGAYSAPVPSYVTPIRASYAAVPPSYNVPQGLAYSNQFYQY